MRLDISKENVARWMSLSPERRKHGIRLVRTLTVSSSDLATDASKIDFCSLLANLKQNALRDIRIECEGLDMAACYTLLRFTQPQLTHTFTINNQTVEGYSTGVTSSVAWSSFIVDADGMAFMEPLTDFLGRSARLDTVDIIASKSALRSAYHTWWTLLAVKQACVHTKHLALKKPPKRCDCKVNISRLSLRGCCFWDDDSGHHTPVQGLRHAISLETLTTLIIFSCQYVTLLLRALAGPGTRLSLKALVVLSDKETPFYRDTFVPAVNELLRHFTGLQTLAISADVHALPAVKSIANHKSTLRVLFIDDTSMDGIAYGAEDVKALTGQSWKLEQVAVPLLPTALARSSEDTTMDGIVEAVDTFAKSMEYLSTLTQLRTLRVLNLMHPANKHDAPVSALALLDLAALVMKIFDRAEQRNMSVVAWGRRLDRLVCHMRVEGRDTNGHLMSSAEIIEPHLVKYEKRVSEILEIAVSVEGLPRLFSVEYEQETS
ncbi:hypothetical protein LTR53_009471 [Teratosphaeriaceae sp. CCFEE 6253]|nr:hypothetical protein LTR53_009471 [Teratosphaeriaceae sp. CCFEE 6253]